MEHPDRDMREGYGGDDEEVVELPPDDVVEEE